MKYCQSCGESIDDEAVVCPNCNSAQTPFAAGTASITEQPTTNPQIDTQDMSQAYTELGEGISGAKKSSKKPLFIILGILAVVAIAFCVWFFVFHKKSCSDKKEIEKKTGEYIEAICNLDAAKVIELTLPKDALQTLVNEMIGNLSEFGYDTSAEFDDNYASALKDAQEYVDSFASDYNLSIDVNNYTITSIDKLNIDDVIESLYNSDPELAAAESLRDIKGIVKEAAKEYDIDLDNIYNVYVTVDAKVHANGGEFNFNTSALAAMFGTPSISMNLPFDIIDNDGGIALFMAYKHKDDYYLIPDIGIFAPQLIKYQQKASIATDMANASIIYTAVQTLLANEEYYEFFTGEGANVIYTIVDYELNALPAECGKELRDLIYVDNQLPRPSLRQDGQTFYAFMVEPDGKVYVYTLDDQRQHKWELMPDQDPPYKY